MDAKQPTFTDVIPAYNAEKFIELTPLPDNRTKSEESLPCSSTTSDRNIQIELLRFVFAIVIVIFHQSSNCCGLFPRGFNAVLFFFLLSGYLAVRSIQRHNDSNISYLKGCASFMKRKFLAVHPEIILTTLAYLIVHIIHEQPSIYSGSTLAIKAFFSDVMFLRMTGIENSTGVWYGWYISSMMIGLLILYPVTRKFWNGIFMFGASLLLFGYIKHSTGSFLPPFDSTLGWTYAGNYSALAGLTMGTSLAAIKIKNQFILKHVTLLSLMLLLICLFCLNAPSSVNDKQQTMNTLILFAMYALLLCVTCREPSKREQGSWGLKCGNCCIFLGKLSLPLYLIHMTCHYICGMLMPGEQGVRYLTIYLGFSLVAAYVVMLAAGWLRRKIARFYK